VGVTLALRLGAQRAPGDRGALLMRPQALLYFYGRRLRVHGPQELLAGLGVAVAVALVFAVTVAAGSLSGSTATEIRKVAGPANLQLHARGPEGFAEDLLTRVQRLPGVAQAAGLLEQTATLIAAPGRRLTVTAAGASADLAVMDGLVRTLPGGVLSGGLGISTVTAQELGIASVAAPVDVTVDLRGRAHRLAISAILGKETAGALSLARVVVMPLGRLQQLAGLPHRVSRILIQSKPGQSAAVRRELQALVGSRITVAAADQEVSLLDQALRPGGQASALFAGLAALLGFLFAFAAILLTVPERRAMLADMRLDGARNSAIVQIVLFQALCLGLLASLVGILGGWALALGFFEVSPGYLSQAFTLGGDTVIGVRPVALAFVGGVLATCLASAVPLQDLRRGRSLNAVQQESRRRGMARERTIHRQLLVIATGLLALASGLFVLAPQAAIAACVLLALATMLAVPLVLDAVLRAAHSLALRLHRLTVLPLAVESLRVHSLRSLALTATGAVALFGSVALGGAQNDLLRGLHNFARAYSADADVWVVNPGYIPETTSFLPGEDLTRIARLPEVTRVQEFQSEFMNMAHRRVVILARPPGTGAELLRTQILAGDFTAAQRHLREGGWATVSQQIAEEQGVGVGQTIRLPTPTGLAHFRLAALTTNFGWPGGAIVLSTTDYSRLWATHLPSALAIHLAPGVNTGQARQRIAAALGPHSGLEVIAAATWRERFDRLAGEGLKQLGNISMLLNLAAILAMAAALGSSIWQRRTSLAELLLDGATRRRLRLILLLESALVLGAGCLTGAVAGIYGQFVIDNYLTSVTGFPVEGIATTTRPIATLVLVTLAVLILMSLPGWLAARVSPALALDR
jgi:putative ABC transport system permease protein